MTTEIKFRAWDKDKEQLEYQFEKISVTEDGHEIKYLAFRFMNGGMPVITSLADCLQYSQRYVVQQFTGLLDKNGKEIYEGDILKTSTIHPLEVFWMGLAWGFRFKDLGNLEEEMICDDGGDASMKEKGQFEYLEIIGNIYENPELLVNK